MHNLILHCARLFVPLTFGLRFFDLKVQSGKPSAFARQYKNKNKFYFALCSLIRTFASDLNRKVMKRQFLTLLAMLLLGGLLTASAQTNMAGRTYHNPNIIADMMNDATKDLDKKVAEARTKGIAEAEKKKGRKLTGEEIAKLDAEIKKKMAELEAMKKGMKLAITIEFKDDKNLVMKQDTKISDEALKAAGYGWLKRKAMKAALAVVPKSHKGTYVVKGNMIIMTDTDNDKDTLNISQDGKYITGKLDKKDRPFKLIRTK